MNRLPLQKNIKLHIIDVMLFLLILISDDTVMFGTATNNVTLALRVTFYIVITAYFLIKYRTIHRKIAVALIIFLFLISATVLFNQTFSNGYILYLSTLLMGGVIASCIKLDIFVHSFIRVISIISGISIVFTLFFLVVPESLFNILPTISNVSEVQFYNFMIYVIPVNSIGNIRNYGIFREPGVFMIYINLAITFLLFYSCQYNKRKRTNFIVLAVALFLTKSTAGYIVFFMIYITYFLYSKKTKTNLILQLSFTLLVLLLYISTNSVFHKLDPNSVDYGSTLARLSSFYVPLEMLQISPIYGVGLQAFSDLYEIISFQLFGIVFTSAGHSTNTILNAAAVFGIPFSILSIYCLVCFAKKITKQNLYFIVVSITMLLMISNEEMKLSSIYNIILFYGATYKLAR